METGFDTEGDDLILPGGNSFSARRIREQSRARLNRLMLESAGATISVRFIGIANISFSDKAVRRIKNHFPVARNEPQLERALMIVRRRGRGINAPGLAVPAARRGRAGDLGRDSSRDLRERLIRDNNRQPALFTFEEIRRHLHLVIARVNIHRALERTDAQGGFSSGDGSGTPVDDENTVRRVGGGRRKGAGPN